MTLRLCFPVALFLLPFLFYSTVQAATAQKPIAPLAQSVDERYPTQPIDVVVLLDDSGSMATCWPWPIGEPPFFPPCRGRSINPPSDPNELRYSAARLMVELADDEDRIAVLRFDGTAGGVGALSNLQQLGPPENRRQLVATLVPPNDYYRRGYTRFDLGLDLAIKLLQENRQSGRDQYVILLTDGEPSQPDNIGHQRDRVQDQVQTLRAAGILTFPVVLCNPSAGCAGQFLRDQFAEYGIREATTAQDLIRVFSELFAEMKPDRSVITGRNGGGALQINTRTEQRVHKLSVITPRAGLSSLQLNNTPVLPQNSLNDPNIALNVVDARFGSSDTLTPGRWVAQISDLSGFAVVQARSYPQLLNPPPSLANSPASARYYPTGKPLLLLARSVGAGITEDLLYNGQRAMQPLGQEGLRSLVLVPDANTAPREITLQLGQDETPLQLVRTFRLEGRSDLPKAEVFAPTASNQSLLEDGRVQLQVGFGPGLPTQQVEAQLYIIDESDDGRLVYNTEMTCNQRLCSHEEFRPEDGRRYRMLYILQGQVDGIRFSDWAQAKLELEPAIYLRGLSSQLDLSQMPAEGWPVEVTSGTTEEIGLLDAQISLRRLNEDGSDTNESLTEVSLDFSTDVPEEGISHDTLKVDGLDTLRPGEYVGEVILSASSPTGRPMEVQIRPSPVLDLQLSVPRPAAHLTTDTVDFGEVLFDTSANFRLDQSVALPLTFEGKPFKVSIRLDNSSCNGIQIMSDDMQQEGSNALLPLQLSSQDIVPPGTCAGTLRLAGPNADYDVYPDAINWQSRVNSVEWSIVSSSLSLGDLRSPGERIQETLLVRFNGKTPFMIQPLSLSATGTMESDQNNLITANEVEVAPVEVSGPPNEAGLYEVPLQFVVRQQIPHDQLQGAFYSGEIQLGIVGLEEVVRSIDFNFRSPSLIQRYVLPVVMPIYAQMPWALCAWPLTLFLLVALVARLRRRDFDEDAWEEAAITTSIQMPELPQASAFDPMAQADGFAQQPAHTDTDSQLDKVWGSTSWGDSSPNWDTVWEQGQAQDRTPDTAPSTNGTGGDPWSSSW